MPRPSATRAPTGSVALCCLIALVQGRQTNMLLWESHTQNLPKNLAIAARRDPAASALTSFDKLSVRIKNGGHAESHNQNLPISLAIEVRRDPAASSLTQLDKLNAGKNTGGREPNNAKSFISKNHRGLKSTAPAGAFFKSNYHAAVHNTRSFAFEANRRQTARDPATPETEDVFTKAIREAHEVVAALANANEATKKSNPNGAPRQILPESPPRGRLLESSTLLQNFRGGAAARAARKSLARDREHVKQAKAYGHKRRGGYLTSASVSGVPVIPSKARLGINVTSQRNKSVANKTQTEMASQAVKNATAFFAMSMCGIIMLGCGTCVLVRMLRTLRNIRKGGEDPYDHPDNARATLCCCSLGPTTLMFLAMIIIFGVVGFWALWTTGIMQEVFKEMIVYIYVILLLVGFALLCAIEVYMDIAYLTANARVVGKAVKKAESMFGAAVYDAEAEEESTVQSTAKKAYGRWATFSKGVDDMVERMLSGQEPKQPPGSSQGPLSAAAAASSAASAAAAANATARASAPQPQAAS